MKYQTINAGDHFGRLETLERIKIGRRIAWICKCSCWADPENVTRLGLYWYPRSTMDAKYSRLFRQVVAVAAGQQYRVDYFNWADLASNARGTLRLTNVNNGKYLDTANGLVYFNNDILRAAVSSGLFMFPCNVLYCGYNREIEKLPITASIA